ncbi:hypothetical protein BS17DRAFT_470201 [Gyrodon lividus]|nr:hypothetical protein BS17DRAFT_470201 [Gyrodon lividus]
MSSSMSQTASKENNIMLPLLRRPGKIAPLKKARPVMKDIQNAFTLQATEARRYVIVQGDPYSSCQVHPTFEGGRHHRHGTPVVKQTILPADPIVTRTPHSRPSPAPSMVSTLQEECSGGYAGASIRGHALRRSSSMIVSRSLDSLRSIASHTQLTQVDPTCAKLPYATLSTKSSRNIVETGNQSNIQRSYDDRDALLFLVPSRSLTPPLSPPMPPSSQTSRGYLPKRSGRTFALISTEVNGKRVFTHAVANQRDVCPGECSSPITISAKSVRSPKDGLPEDMRDILRQLDDLASWVKAASLSGECTSPVPTVTSMQHSARPACHSETETECGAEFATEHSAHTSPFNKGKGRVLSTRTTCSESSAPTASIQFSSAQTSGPTNVDRSADCPSEGLIYEPNVRAFCRVSDDYLLDHRAV